jgi:hypothetical protein
MIQLSGINLIFIFMKNLKLIPLFLLLLSTILPSGIAALAQNVIVINGNPNPPIQQAPVTQPQNNYSSNVIVIGVGSNNQIVQNISNQPAPVVASNNIESSGFNPGNVLSDNEIYSLPTKFDSASKIRDYLRSTGSFLANYQVDISFEADDDLFATAAVRNNIGNLAGTKMDFSEFVWRIARTNLGNSCSLRNRNICIDQQTNPINPAVILSLIQRESGLIKGRNAKLDVNSDTAKFLADRSVGYLCLEDDDKTKSCWDQNPDWKYFKGMFRQVYYGMRLMLINSKRCDIGNYGSAFRTGNSVNIDGQPVKLENGFTCSIYIYTPHIMAQRNIYKVYKEIVA